ncbi:signal peptidase II [uncultured Eubacterium sp.]|uniref:signal peptidase II n=1 Tax=uncultured Eubacterium sp. TaxID=165185 RepID=UPI002805880A|nr:signal peptidase II [uncultured Eubacterium sp.]
MKHTKKHISCSIMIILIVAFDQITKYFASLKLADGSVAKFIPGVVQFKYAENTGMAFSMLSGARWVFIALTVVVCVGVFYYLFSNRCKSLWLYWSLGVILSGGIGNLIDRIRFGYVVDFIEPTFVNFAIFNIADCAVTCGAVVLVGYLLYDAFKDVKKPKENSDG